MGSCVLPIFVANSSTFSGLISSDRNYFPIWVREETAIFNFMIIQKIFSASLSRCCAFSAIPFTPLVPLEKSINFITLAKVLVFYGAPFFYSSKFLLPCGVVSNKFSSFFPVSKLLCKKIYLMKLYSRTKTRFHKLPFTDYLNSKREEGEGNWESPNSVLY